MKGKDALAAVLLLLPVLAYLPISAYSVVQPSLFGLPYYYWYQVLWLFLAALFYSAAAMILSRRE